VPVHKFQITWNNFTPGTDMDEGAAQSQIGPTGHFKPVQVLLEKYGS